MYQKIPHPLDLYKNSILVLDEVLTPEECRELIYSYKPTKQWRTTYPMSITGGFELQMAKKIQSQVNKYFKEVEIDWSEVVRWPPGSDQPLHFDTTSEETILTSITYLNVTYSGGQTYIENDMKVVPKVGRTVIFDGRYYKHGVTEVSNSDRYTLPIWYKINTNK